MFTYLWYPHMAQEPLLGTTFDIAGTEGNSPMFPKIDWCKLGISTSLDLTDGFIVSWRGKIIILIT